MKKLVILCSLLPLLAISQEKKIISAERLFPKTDKIAEFEKAVAAHAQKYHTGALAWRTYDIISGPDAGGVMITEGPHSWTDLDNRGNISPEHNADFTKTIAPLTTDRNSSIFSEYRPEFSTIKLTEFVEKIAITHITLKPGYITNFETLLRKMQKVWEANGQSVAVYSTSSSGPFKFLIVTRYKNGWKDRDNNFGGKTFIERFEAANGPGSMEDYRATNRMAVESTWSEMLVYNASLSSK